MHPGEMLRENALPAIGKSKTEIAWLPGISRQTPSAPPLPQAAAPNKQ